MSIENFENQSIKKKEEINEEELNFEKTRSTFRGIEEVCRVLGLEKEQFKNKVVLDVGSGLGGLALDFANFPELKTQIVSLDPRYTKESLQKSLVELQEKCKKAGVNSPKTEKELAVLKRKFNISNPVALFEATKELEKKGQPTIGGFAELLPFKDKSFDMVLSSYAIPVGIEESPERIQKAIQEIGRVLKIDGEAYLGPVPNELKDFINSLPLASDIKRKFRESKVTEEEAAKYGVDSKWVLILQKLKNLDNK